jgi:hypothetical protein
VPVLWFSDIRKLVFVLFCIGESIVVLFYRDYYKALPMGSMAPGAYLTV